jgi:hypothetical protein
VGSENDVNSLWDSWNFHASRWKCSTSEWLMEFCDVIHAQKIKHNYAGISTIILDKYRVI